MSSSLSLSEISSHEAEHHHESSNSRRNSKWVIDVKEKIDKIDKSKEVDHWKKIYIYQIPACVKDLNKKAYMPQAVSFGPYHHGDNQLKQMEEHKHRALLHFLKRSKNPIESYMDALHRVDQYGNYTDQFLQLMMLDGCFMLEILRTATQTTDDYASNDPIFSSHGKLNIMPYIRRDMLMLQNQLPMLLLETLLGVESGGKPKTFTGRTFFNSHDTNQTHLHGTDDYSESSGDIIRSARELYEAGIRFKTSKTVSLKDISFGCGVLRLPEILVDDTTESTFLNLMAYERFHVGEGSEDVSLLHSKGTIKNALGSDKAVAKLFNELSKDVAPDNSLDEVHKKVNDYCKKKWNEWRANLIHTYFRSPWAVLSVLAAIFLMALTIVQTIYTNTLLAHHHHYHLHPDLISNQILS
ncbi:hypothetical protein MKX01_039251 [Papaver californicum]|nr:hypothetical protein MKX01_039251 [Papaver californicum]